eukprot:1161218-Pelagomonas_calceolata.AAC.6
MHSQVDANAQGRVLSGERAPQERTHSSRPQVDQTLLDDAFALDSQVDAADKIPGLLLVNSVDEPLEGGLEVLHHCGTVLPYMKRINM